VIDIGTTNLPGVNKLKVIITNHGKTTAILDRITIINNFFFTKHFDITPLFGTYLIESGSYEIFYPIFFVHGNEEWKDIVSGQLSLICEGRLFYRDVWAITQDEIGFCWQYNDLFEKFIPTQDRNYRRQRNQ
jgi:hypothetical protein